MKKEGLEKRMLRMELGETIKVQYAISYVKPIRSMVRRTGMDWEISSVPGSYSETEIKRIQ